MSDPQTANAFFEEFPPVSTEQWEAKIKEDLKGADYKKKLRWDTGEGINPLPFYRRENMQRLERSAAPITSAVNHPWEVCETVYASSSTIEEASQAAQQALNRGADALQLSLRISISTDAEGNVLQLQGLPLQTQTDFVQLMKGVPLDQTPLHIDAGIYSPAILGMLWQEVKAQSISGGDIRGTVCYDPLASRLRTGQPSASGELSENISQITSFCLQHFPSVRPLGINGRIFHNSGGMIVQELGFALASATEYLAILTENDCSIEDAANILHFNFAIGSNYFLEIAKLRAIRLLWQNILNAFGGDPEQYPAYIHAETSQWNKTGYAPYTNMLRTSSEGMSAVIGGCDTLTVLPFDESFRQPDNFSQRIARNSQIIMREEAYLHKVRDIAAGSYYIEQLTEDLARKAWQLFQEVEKRGGMSRAIEDGFVQSSINSSRQQRDQTIARRERIFVGTSQYPNPDERQAEELAETIESTVLQTTDRDLKTESSYSIEKISDLFADGATLGDVAELFLSTSDPETETLQPYRGPQVFEKLRMATEQQKAIPTVLNLPLGHPKIRKARSTFSNNFFGCVGYDMEDPIGFDDIPEAVDAIKQKQPAVAVLCSSDKEYEQLVPELCKQLDKIEHRPLLVLAGYPEEKLETYKKAGIDLFIHSDCNVLEVLKEVHQKLHIIKNDK